jgi:hypothetical protein
MPELLPIETCRDAVFEAFARLESRTDRVVFSLSEIVAEVRSITRRYPEATIRTQVASVMCVEAPVHHEGHTNDLERVSRGQYRRVVPNPRNASRKTGGTMEWIGLRSRNAPRTTPQWDRDGGPMILVGCVSEKGPEPAPAKDLYRSPL